MMTSGLISEELLFSGVASSIHYQCLYICHVQTAMSQGVQVRQVGCSERPLVRPLLPPMPSEGDGSQPMAPTDGGVMGTSLAALRESGDEHVLLDAAAVASRGEPKKKDCFPKLISSPPR